MQLQTEDAVSNKICNQCWKHLDNFHKFWLLIEEKQQTLEKQAPKVKWNLHDDDSVEKPLSWQEEDVKDIPLFEQPIDAALHVQPELKVEEFGAASSDDEVYRSDDGGHISDGKVVQVF